MSEGIHVFFLPSFLREPLRFSSVFFSFMIHEGLCLFFLASNLSSRERVLPPAISRSLAGFVLSSTNLLSSAAFTLCIMTSMDYSEEVLLFHWIRVSYYGIGRACSVHYGSEKFISLLISF